MVSKKENENIWKRAQLFFKENNRMLGSDETAFSDTLIVNDYYNPYRKDSYLSVRRKFVQDTVIYVVTAGVRGKDDPDFEKEVALYLRTGKNRYPLQALE
jgi:hypothetical protein